MLALIQKNNFPFPQAYFGGAWGICLQRQWFKAQPLKKLRASMATDEPFFLGSGKATDTKSQWCGKQGVRMMAGVPCSTQAVHRGPCQAAQMPPLRVPGFFSQLSFCLAKRAFIFQRYWCLLPCTLSPTALRWGLWENLLGCTPLSRLPTQQLTSGRSRQPSNSALAIKSHRNCGLGWPPLWPEVMQMWCNLWFCWSLIWAFYWRGAELTESEGLTETFPQVYHAASVMWLHPHIACLLRCFICVWLCDLMDGHPLGSSGHRILQANILAWVSMPSSRGSSQPRDRTHICYISCIERWVLYH